MKASEHVERCPICDNNSFSPLHTIKDYTTSLEMFHVKQCIGCGLVITSPRPSEETAQQYYQSDAYISHTSASNSAFGRIYLIVRHFTLRWKYSLVKSHLKNGALLDYGCGTGHFLQEVKRRGHSVYGVEPSDHARSKIESTIPSSANIQTLPSHTYEVITLWHVLEHVYDLRGTLRTLKSRLTKNGTIFIAVPNMESYDANYYVEHWAAYDVPRHLWHFTKTTMTSLLEKEGLLVRNILPMKLDAFYVSILSEKYRNNGRLSAGGAIRAFWVGFRSNFSGRHKRNHSSLIFVVQQ